MAVMQLLIFREEWQILLATSFALSCMDIRVKWQE
jgi:hypothetical protein